MGNKLEFSAVGENDLLFTRSFNAPRQLVWDAHTKPELVKRWLCGPPGWSLPVCEIDLQVGGKLRYEWQHENGQRMGMSGEFTAIDTPERLEHTELFDQDWTGGETLVRSSFSEADGRTLVTMSVSYSSAEARAAALQTGMTDGMEYGYGLLDALLVEQHN